MSDFVIVFLFGTDVTVILIDFAKISPLRNRRELIVIISVY
jgi:hypothetical protein